MVDVRSAPYSRYAPQFNREALAAAVERARRGAVAGIPCRAGGVGVTGSGGPQRRWKQSGRTAGERLERGGLVELADQRHEPLAVRSFGIR